MILPFILSAKINKSSSIATNLKDCVREDNIICEQALARMKGLLES